MNRHSPQPHKFLWESRSSSGTRDIASHQRYRDHDRRINIVTNLVNDDSEPDRIYRDNYPPYDQEGGLLRTERYTYETPSFFQSTYRRISSLADSIIMLPSGLSNMSSPPIDARNVSDDRIQASDTSSGKRIPHHPNYETTLDGDVVIVQPSFDDHEVNKSPMSPSPVKRSQQEWQARSPQQDRKKEVKDDSGERNPSSPEREESNVVERRHIRNLSAHFYDATSLDDPDMYEGEHENKKHLCSDDVSIESSSGRKHRRIFSGDFSNPNIAHRRIDSIGNSTPVNRQYHQHHREHSAGLDILSAAVLVDVTKDELAAVAGQTYNSRHEVPLRPSWEHPSARPQQYYQYAPGHPLSGPPSYPHHGNDNPHMHPPNRRLGSGPAVPPLLPALHSMNHPPYVPPSHHHGYAGHHGTSYPPNSYYHHQGMQHHHHQGIPPQVSYYPSAYTSRGPVPPPESSHTPPYPTQHYVHSRAYPAERKMLEKPVSSRKGRQQGPPVQSAPVDPAWNPTSTNPLGSTNQGSQTFVTAIAVGSGKKTIRRTSHRKNAATNTEDELLAKPTSAVPSHVMGHHHRKMSSFSSVGLGTIFGAGPVLSPGAPDTPSSHTLQHPLKSEIAPVVEEKPHHRSISSVSFLNVLDSVGHENELFLRNLQESVPEYRSPTASVKDGEKPASPVVSTAAPDSTGNNSDYSSGNENKESKLASGGTSKRVRRKCTIAGCHNRVVQGGLCIAHGAKRKMCNYPGCPKHVKKAGYCSTHGPSRKKCEAPNCPKVAVQGGHCIAHGAKKKLCCFPDCNKQAILTGMCKKHHDQNKGELPEGESEGAASSVPVCREVMSEASRPGQQLKPNHTRGLSIFHDISADTVSSLLNNTTNDVPDPAESPLRVYTSWPAK